MNTPPPLSTDDRSRAERRLVGHALAHWDRLRGGRAFPTRDDFDAAPPDCAPEAVYLVAVGSDEASDRFVRVGEAVSTALGRDPVGLAVTEVLPSATEMGLSFCRTVADMKKPIADVGRFTNAAGADVWYRSILLPLSDDQAHINYVVGVFSYKFAN